MIRSEALDKAIKWAQHAEEVSPISVRSSAHYAAVSSAWSAIAALLPSTTIAEVNARIKAMDIDVG